VIAAGVVELAAQPLDVVLGAAKLLLQFGALGVAVLLMAVERRAGVPQLGIERGRT
jgi:ribosomal protein S3